MGDTICKQCFRTLKQIREAILDCITSFMWGYSQVSWVWKFTMINYECFILFQKKPYFIVISSDYVFKIIAVNHTSGSVERTTLFLVSLKWDSKSWVRDQGNTWWDCVTTGDLLQSVWTDSGVLLCWSNNKNVSIVLKLCSPFPRVWC